jgi:hypothetical protein
VGALAEPVAVPLVGGAGAAVVGAEVVPPSVVLPAAAGVPVAEAPGGAVALAEPAALVGTTGCGVRSWTASAVQVSGTGAGTVRSTFSQVEGSGRPRTTRISQR